MPLPYTHWSVLQTPDVPNAPPQEAVASQNGVRAGFWASGGLVAAFPGGSPAWPEYKAESRSPPSRGLPCITPAHNCILMDAANTTLYVCHGPSDLSDPWVKGAIFHLYEQLPVTGLHDKSQRRFDEVNNLAPSIMTYHSQILMPFQGLLRQTNEMISPLLMMLGQHKLYTEAKLHPRAYEF